MVLDGGPRSDRTDCIALIIPSILSKLPTPPAKKQFKTNRASVPLFLALFSHFLFYIYSNLNLKMVRYRTGLKNFDRPSESLENYYSLPPFETHNSVLF